MTASKNSNNKPMFSSIPVLLDDGTQVKVRRTTHNKLARLIELQDELLKAYIEVDGAVSQLFIKSEIIDQLTEYFGLLPLEGKEGEFLSFESISDNWEQIVQLAFNGCLDEKTRQHNNDVTPSKISNLHFLPFNESLQTHIHEKKLQTIRILQTQQEEMEQASLSEPKPVSLS